MVSEKIRRKGSISNLLTSLTFSGGSDETRTRDLRRDRASFQCMNKRSALKPQRFRDLLRPVSPSWTPSNPKSGNKLGTKRMPPFWQRITFYASPTLLSLTCAVSHSEQTPRCYL